MEILMAELAVGFYRFSAYPGNVSSAAYVVPNGWHTVTIGGPETREQIAEKIKACEKTLEQLRAQLAAML